MDSSERIDIVNKRELEDREQNKDVVPNLNYTGAWSDGGHKLSDGTELGHGVLWEFLTRYKYMSKLSNITDQNNVAITCRDAEKLDSCLELGCDWGHCFCVFENFFNKVCGIEAMEWPAKLGKRNGLDITHGVMESMPYEDNTFDVVLSNHVLEHGVSPDVVLGEIKRVTKIGGWSLHTLPCKINAVAESETLIHKSNINYMQWLLEFELAGFVVIRNYFSWNHDQEEWNIIARRFQ